MNGLASLLYQLVLLAVATFAFLVLFQHGPDDFAQHAQEELAWVKSLVGRKDAAPAPGN
jgi:hypothetical protein